MAIDSMKDLFIHELRDLYDAENQILEALPKMADKSTHQELKDAFEEHRSQTEGHVQRLERIFEGLGEKADGVKCKGIRGIISEGEDMLDDDVEEDVRDAAIIAAAQRVEHYEIASYGSARTYARMLGDENSARLLQETLDEEGETNKKLTALAESRVNRDAMRA